MNPKHILHDEYCATRDFWRDDDNFACIQPPHIADRLRGPLYIGGAVAALFGIGVIGVLPVEVSTDPRGYLIAGAIMIACHLAARDREPQPRRRRPQPVRFPPAHVGETIRLKREQ